MSGGSFPEPAMLIKNAAEAGPVRTTVHPLRLNGRGVAGFGIAWLCLPVIVFLVGLAGSAGALVPALYMLVIAAVGLAYPLAALIGTRIRICENGLVVSTLTGKRGRFFIPYASIDMGSVMVHPVPRRGGANRYKALTALREDYPWPAMSELILATCPVRPRIAVGPPYGQPLNVWGAPYSKHGISFRALHPVFASPWWRARPAIQLSASRWGRRAMQHPARAQWVLSAMRPLLNYPGLVPVVIHNDQPMMRWMFGTDRPDQLLRVIEEAMVAAGVPGAHGFTARALASPYDRPPTEIPAEPELW
jgi:hypothetical protein